MTMDATREDATGAHDTQAAPLQQKADPVQQTGDPLQQEAAPVQQKVAAVQQKTRPAHQNATEPILCSAQQTNGRKALEKAAQRTTK